MEVKQLIELAKKMDTILAKVKVKKKSYGFTIKVIENEITVECGWDYPNSIYGKVTAAAEKVGLPYKHLSVCADVSLTEGTEKYRGYVNGGKKAWSRY